MILCSDALTVVVQPEGGSLSTPKNHTSNINSDLVHVWIHTILFSHISLSFVSCSLPSNLIMAGGEALAVKKKTKPNNQTTKHRKVVCHAAKTISAANASQAESTTSGCHVTQL